MHCSNAYIIIGPLQLSCARPLPPQLSLIRKTLHSVAVIIIRGWQVSCSENAQPARQAQLNPAHYVSSSSPWI